MPIDRHGVVSDINRYRLRWILESIYRIRERQEKFFNDAIRFNELQWGEIDYIKWEIDLIIRQFKCL